ncbi:MAG: restriction endonuclease subunit S [Verrucomicrobiota bacterium]|jgi:type I restriction enzyme S subunit
MKNDWPISKLGEVLTERHESPKEDDLASGRVRVIEKISFDSGRVQLRIDGSTKTGMILVRPGDLVLSGINAAKGAIAIYDAEETAPIAATIHYGAYETKPDRADVRFLWWMLRSHFFREILLEYAPGGIKTELKARRLLPVPVPLPSLAEQRRLVQRIEELAAQIQEASTLRRQASEEADALLRSILKNDDEAQPTPLRELVKLRSPDVVVRKEDIYQFAGVYCFGRGVFKSSCRSGMDFAYPRLTRLRAGQFVYPKLMAWEGAFGVVPPECHGCVVSTEFPVFEVDENRVLHEVLDIYFRTPAVWPDIAGASTGTNVRRRRLNPEDFLNYKLPLPSRKTQVTLRKVHSEVDALKRLQAETAAELDALLPAILDKAFKGEL